MLYRLLKLPAKLALLFWCRHLRINKRELLLHNGPLLIAANHPNSFLDAILLCTLFKKTVYALARGDVFANPFYNKLLRSLNMFPVYRLSEGAENIGHNYKTFDDCIDIFKQNGIVLIFSEGKCINEWNLRSLKKGTARLALDAWQQNIPLQVLPTGINYNSFTTFGKNVFLNFGKMITKENFGIQSGEPEGIRIQHFNQILKTQLERLVFQIKPADPKIISEKFHVPVSPLKKILLFLPACVGYTLHIPLYLPVKSFSFKKFGKIDHFDSVVVGMLFLLYPFYLILIAFIIGCFMGGYWWALTFLFMPFAAWSFVQLKKQI